MAWIYLFVAGLFEVVWAIAMKYAEGFTKPLSSGIMVVAMLISIFFLSQALKTLPVGTGYAVWTGIGAVGTALMGILLFGESRDIARVLFIFLIIIGIAGLKLTTSQ
jgi:quaternary ammonium compound-resistance protein SugE